ncbi:MAG: hypothetical protein VW235_13455, partial [Rhodospirillaceae bacterium]
MKKTTQRCVSLLIFIIVPGLCLAEDLPSNQKKNIALTVQEAAELVKKANETRQQFVANELDLNWLTSIDQDIARELSQYKGYTISLDGLSSISKEV